MRDQTEEAVSVGHAWGRLQNGLAQAFHLVELPDSEELFGSSQRLGHG
jgi:hypothetical protein